MCPTVQRLFLCAAILFWQTFLVAQTSDTIRSAPTNNSNFEAEVQTAAFTSDSAQVAVDIPIEEILVIGEKTMVGMRLEIRRLDQDISEQLNELIEDELYQLSCELRRYRSSQVRTYTCQPGYVMIARNYAFEEGAALTALNELSQDLFIEPDAIIPNTTDNIDLTQFAGSSLADFDSTDGQLMTELQRHQNEFEQIVFSLAQDNNQLAEQLVRRYYLELALEHKKKNWWKYFFRREVEEIQIPTSLVRLIR